MAIAIIIGFITLLAIGYEAYNRISERIQSIESAIAELAKRIDEITK